MMRFPPAVAFAAALLPLAPLAVVADIARHDFGEVLQGDVVEHEFALANPGDSPTRIANVRLTPPLALARTPAVVPAGGQVGIRVRLDTSKVQGKYEGRVVLVTSQGERSYVVAGQVLPPIEVLPLPAFFISTSRGAAKSASLEIVNREKTALALQVPAKAAALGARLETLEPGKRFRLTVDVPADAPPGRRSDRIELATSSARKPVLFVGLNTLVRERVYTFPESVDLGRLSGGPGAETRQTLMAYQTGGRDFRVEASSDIPGLTVRAEPGPQGDRVQLTIGVEPSRAGAGPITGTLVLRTNDPEFPELRVPVTGSLEK